MWLSAVGVVYYCKTYVIIIYRGTIKSKGWPPYLEVAYKVNEKNCLALVNSQ